MHVQQSNINFNKISLAFLASTSFINIVLSIPLDKRTTGATCTFPEGLGLVAISPNAQNAGWALSPDQPCSPGNFCPYACPPGQLMAQWDASATSYTYPQSQYGGLYCDKYSALQKPFAYKDYCYEGKGTLIVENQANQDVAFCQTVLPGNEAMLIPTNIIPGNGTVMAVPGTEYWAGTAAHYYVNPPGVSTENGCVWGSTTNPLGNWSPYVAGANMDDYGNTYVKIGWNPVYFEDTCPFKAEMPSYGLRVSCTDESKCNGGSCEIDPSKSGINGIESPSSGLSLGASFCIITATQNSTAKIEVFEVQTGSTVYQKFYNQYEYK